MISVHILLFASFFIPALAGKFSLSITQTKGFAPKSYSSFEKRQDRTQKPLNGNSKFSSDAPVETQFYSDGVPIEAQNFFLYTTNISLGTPPQSFRAVVDLNWADLSVPSSDCFCYTGRYCNPGNATYNASASSTYYDNGTITQISYGPFDAFARLSEDVLTFADGLQIPGQVFHDIKYYQWVDYYYTDLFDSAVLGLTIDKQWFPGNRGPPEAENILPSPFRSMIDNNLLDENKFSIVWPSETQKEGSLTFGGYDETLLYGELTSLPLFPENTTKWQVELESISMIGDNDCGGKKVLVDKSIPGGKAFFMSVMPFIAFPYTIAQSLVHHMYAWNSPCGPYFVVDCDDVGSLPEITIGLKGQNVTLRGEDYVQKIEVPGYCQPPPGGECVVMIDSVMDTETTVILGMPFLKKMMGVFNWDEKTVSCEFPHLSRDSFPNINIVGGLKG
ncbi:acid protease [Stipitochalara longipes BDJ]|nr:acid protease [Stipitochalara longipes BDJ]